MFSHCKIRWMLRDVLTRSSSVHVRLKQACVWCSSGVRRAWIMILEIGSTHSRVLSLHDAWLRIIRVFKHDATMFSQHNKLLFAKANDFAISIIEYLLKIVCIFLLQRVEIEKMLLKMSDGDVTFHSSSLFWLIDLISFRLPLSLSLSWMLHLDENPFCEQLVMLCSASSCSSGWQVECEKRREICN